MTPCRCGSKKCLNSYRQQQTGQSRTHFPGRSFIHNTQTRKWSHRRSFTTHQHEKDVHRQSFHFDTEDTGPAYTQVQIQPRGPLDPLTTAVLDRPPGRAAKRLAPPGRLKRDLNKAHLHLGDLLPDPLRVAHLRRSCELLRDAQAKFSFRHRRTPDRRTHRCKFNTARGPLDPLTTAVLDQPPGRAAKRLAPPRGPRLKRDLNTRRRISSSR